MPSVFAAPGERKIYKYYARAEGTFLLHSLNDNQNGQLAGLLVPSDVLLKDGIEWVIINEDAHTHLQTTYLVEVKEGQINISGPVPPVFRSNPTVSLRLSITIRMRYSLLTNFPE